MKCDECYTITWRESKYTLIHLKYQNRLRLTQVKKAMVSLNSEHGIISNAIEGYDAFSCNDKAEEHVTQHPGFERMIELLNTDSSEIRSWLEDGDLLTYKKGLLYKYLQSTDPKKRPRSQMDVQVKKMNALTRENTELKEEIQTLRSTLTAETTRSDQYFQKLMDQKEECDELRMRLLALNGDITWTKKQ